MFAERYDTAYTNVFQVEEDLARGVANRLQASLKPAATGHFQPKVLDQHLKNLLETFSRRDKLIRTQHCVVDRQYQ